MPSRAGWTRAIDATVRGLNVSVSVGVGDRILYARRGSLPRMPASNEKLLTSMAALDAFGPRGRLPTAAASARPIRDGLLRGDLWLVGGGDPELSAATLARLASELSRDGLARIRGSVIGDTGTFDRGWWAPGWVPNLSRDYVRRPTALAFDGNAGPGPPELAAATSLTASLRSLGVAVRGEPRASDAPDSIATLAVVRSAPLRTILARQNHGSINFDAEMLTKALGEVASSTGSTAAGGRAIEVWARSMGVRVVAEDGSGLSHLDRVTTSSLVRLLLLARRRPWGGALVDSLPAPGQGTLTGRLGGLPVRAKTGTLFVTPASALSGYVTDAAGRRAAFSVLSRGLDKGTAIAIEDRVVAILAGADLG